MSQNLAGKTFLITGSNTGVGRATAEDLARQGARIWLACRSRDKTLPVIEQIKQQTGNPLLEFLELDLADLSSVHQAAEQFLEHGEPLHALINNAGLAGQRGLTKQGFELTFGVNHLGHFLLTQLLLDRLKADAPSRIVNVASKAHYQARGVDFSALRQTTSFMGLREYSVSKLCNVLFAKELARRLEGTRVTTYAVHPGVVASDIWRRLPQPLRALGKLWMISNEEGARTSVHCATSEKVAGETGRYYDSSREKRPSRFADDAALAKELWERSEEWTA